MSRLRIRFISFKGAHGRRTYTSWAEVVTPRQAQRRLDSDSWTWSRKAYITACLLNGCH